MGVIFANGSVDSSVGVVGKGIGSDVLEENTKCDRVSSEILTVDQDCRSYL